MKQLIKLTVILLLFLILKAESCTDGNEMTSQEKFVDQRIKQLKSLFQADYLSEADLVEFEKSAKQKLSDFTDYLKILTDSSLQQPFREKAGEMIRSIFVSDSIRIKIYVSLGNNLELSILQLVQDGLNNKIPAVRINFESLKTDQPFLRDDQDHYSAILSAMQSTTEPVGEHSIKISIGRKIDAHINKENKIIGNDTLLVWVLHLGKIESR
jgi:hypothetical protein